MSDSGSAAYNALIRAGIEVFGRDGYAGASNRALGDAAGVNPALIAYHFGGKEGLYLAVFRSMTEHVGEVFHTLAEQMEQVFELPEGAQRQALCLEHIQTILTRHAQLVFQPEMQSFAKLLSREQLEPTKAFRVLFDGMMGRVLRLLTRLIAGAIGKDEPGEDEKLSALMLMGQVYVFRAARATVTAHMQWPDMPQIEHIEQIVKRVQVHAEGVVTALRLQHESSSNITP